MIPIDQCRPVVFMLTGRHCRGLHRQSHVSVKDARLRHPAWRQGLRQQRHSPAGRGRRRFIENPALSQLQMEELLLALPLSKPQRHRAHVL